MEALINLLKIYALNKDSTLLKYLKHIFFYSSTPIFSYSCIYIS
ncbi:hypothetical protein CNEO4_1340012 [Clostridium neonatale]|nr:hypothetical protein CNEO3_460004 [Clostridium neonatale]CAI4138521.1 hypothetical protein CNEO4_1340012 [Clostridium neonatale]